MDPNKKTFFRDRNEDFLLTGHGSHKTLAEDSGKTQTKDTQGNGERVGTITARQEIPDTPQ